ncbi:uncharacterized protein MYCFIDRAFT_86649 [Pseudocercospora fijiensis CIRAD86]|uniref:Septin-type G domain-containing protein n=1 Tax=Pseudocercospora fijiensis (strain CIRAD86) TaxID=383855 RepID=M3A665_PSEFD|nr:uncharacterized protein MYCFIDRAFT_86649 [Pseudocercospora fijiensis CIRAD86]EME86604.1 hypothetical protein MYCFIDRAFT_86649 [Pseudocercospora fijiensis CIRAD86]
MAAGLTSADYLQDGVDWAKPHRVPPPPPQTSPPRAAVPYPNANTTGGFFGRALGAVSLESLKGAGRSRACSETHPASRAGPATREEVNGGIATRQSEDGRPPSSQRARRGSFSFLRRTRTDEQHNSLKATITSPAPAAYYTDATPLPLPSSPQQRNYPSLIAQATERQSEDRKERAMLRKSSRIKKEEAERAKAAAAAAAAVPKEPPQINPLTSLNHIASFGVDESRPDSVAIFNHAYTTAATSGSPPSQPRSFGTNFSRPGHMAPSSNFANSSSPAYTSRYGPPASSSPPEHKSRLNGGGGSGDPRRVRRRKDPTPFNILVIGAKNSGKTSFISFLKHSLALPAHKQPSTHSPSSEAAGNHSPFASTYLETEIESERIGVTLWDSAGLEKNVVDLQLREMTAFVESKFEETFAEEQKVMRTPGAKDTHIHCVFLILDPVRLDSTIAESTAQQRKGLQTGSLDDDLDLQVMRALWGKTTVIPIISKADTLTVGHMSFLKRRVWESLKGARLDPLEALELEEDLEEEDEEDIDVDSAEDSDSSLPLPKSRKSHKRQSSLSAIAGVLDDDETPYIPMSIISPDPYDLPPYLSKARAQDRVGRRFPWGFADPYDANHCDFGRLKDSIFSEWRTDLRELSRSRWYENWRTSRLKNFPGSRQRVKGGVTPVAAVPKEGRIASQTSQNYSHPQTANMAVPRSVSNLSSSAAGVGMSTPTPAATNGGRRVASGASEGGSVRNATMTSNTSKRFPS